MEPGRDSDRLLILASPQFGKILIFVKDDVSQLTHIVGGIVGAVIGYSWNMKSGGRK